MPEAAFEEKADPLGDVLAETQLETEAAVQEALTQDVEAEVPVVGDPDADKSDISGGELPSDADLRLDTKKFVMLSLLEKASSVLPSRDIMDVLKNFQITAEPGKIRVVATDLELSVVAESEMVKVQRVGTAVFPGKRFLELVREAEDGEIVIDVKDGVADISVARTTWELHLTDGSDYPELPMTEDLDFYPIQRTKFVDALTAVRYAAATDTVRPTLMMIDIKEGKMRAADGVRFQQVALESWPEDFDLQIPINAVEDLMKLLRTTELQTIDVAEAEDHIVFRIGSDTFLVNKLVAEFPPVDEMLLKPALANNEKLSVDRLDFVSAIKRIRVTADEETSAIVLALDKNKMHVKSKDKYGNMASEDVDVYWQSPQREVAFNHQHLLDMLLGTDLKSCEFFFGEDKKTRKSPLLLKDDSREAFGVLNQIRIDFLD